MKLFAQYISKQITLRGIFTEKIVQYLILPHLNINDEATILQAMPKKF